MRPTTVSIPKGSPLHAVPIFDTNIFADVARGVITAGDWRALVDHGPKDGWALSAVTVLELLAGTDGIRPESFPRLREQARAAWDLSRGNVLEEPRPRIFT